jgi:glycosyltransferase involved in cell wall biosynthesis
VDLDEWPSTDPRPRDPALPLRLIQVGSLNRVKDQATALRAVGVLAERGVPCTLDLVGEDTLAGEGARLAGELGVGDRVRFHGFLPQRRLRPLVAGSHLMLVSSLHEGDPVAFLEAAVTGVPTVGTAVGHVRDWAPEASVAVPVGDALALAREIARLAADDARRLLLASAARQRAVCQDADWSAAGTLALYERLAGAPRHG